MSMSDWRKFDVLSESLGQVGGAVTGYIEKKQAEDKLQRRKNAVSTAMARMRAGGAQVPDLDYGEMGGDNPENAYGLAKMFAPDYNVHEGALVKMPSMGGTPTVENMNFVPRKATGSETGGLLLSNGRYVNSRDEALASLQDPTLPEADKKALAAYHASSLADAERIARLTSGLTQSRQKEATQADISRDSRTKADQLGAANTAAGTKEVEITRRIQQLMVNGEPTLKAEKAELMKLREDLRKLQSDRSGNVDEINKLHHILNQGDPSLRLKRYDPKTGMPTEEIAQRFGNYTAQYLG